MKKLLQIVFLGMFMGALLLTACTEEIAPTTIDTEPDTETLQIEESRGSEGEEDDSTRWDDI